LALIEKIVFISYRRTNASWALAIYQHLTQNGYDVFFDFKGIASGDFESIILENVRARAHFLVLLSPSALRRCSEADDWLRREIETAIEAKRNIVPVMLPGFRFRTPTIAQQLTGKLKSLSQYNALNVPVDYFAEAMGRLRDHFLNVALDAVSHPATSHAQNAAKMQQAAAGEAPAAGTETLEAETYFEQGLSAVDREDKIRLYTEAILLKPDIRGAVADYDPTAKANAGAKEKRLRVGAQTVSSRHEAVRQQRSSGKDAPGRKNSTATRLNTEEQKPKPRKRKKVQAVSPKRSVASTKPGHAILARQKEQRALQDAAADREIERIRRERLEESEKRRMEKEAPVQAWLKRLLSRQA
jgi:TIR domain